MNTRNRNLLTVALATALAPPLAAASGLPGLGSDAVAQTETTMEELKAEENATEALPPQVNPIEEREQGVDPRAPVDDDAEDPMNAVPPPAPVPMQAQGTTQAVDHSNVAQRARWTALDTNGDGRIDVQEGAVDADFNANFQMMDGDGDGFVTDAEYRGHAMASPPRNDDGMRDRMDDDGADDMDRDIDDGNDDGNDGVNDDMDDMDDGINDGIGDPVDGTA